MNDLRLLYMICLTGKLTCHVFLCSLPPGIQINSADNGFKSILEIVLPICSAIVKFPASETETAAKIKSTCQASKCIALHETCPHLRQLSLGTIGEACIQIRAGGKLQHGIAKKFQTLVMRYGVFRFIRIRGMGQRLIKKCEVVEGNPHLRRKTHELREPFVLHVICHCITSDIS